VLPFVAHFRFPIKVRVPKGSILVGLEGGASRDAILGLASGAKAAGVGGIMVWYVPAWPGSQTDDIEMVKVTGVKVGYRQM
jgi:hypothetical protein